MAEELAKAAAAAKAAGAAGAPARIRSSSVRFRLSFTRSDNDLAAKGGKCHDVSAPRCPAGYGMEVQLMSVKYRGTQNYGVKRC